MNLSYYSLWKKLFIYSKSNFNLSSIWLYSEIEPFTKNKTFIDVSHSFFFLHTRAYFPFDFDYILIGSQKRNCLVFLSFYSYSMKSKRVIICSSWLFIFKFLPNFKYLNYSTHSFFINYKKSEIFHLDLDSKSFEYFSWINFIFLLSCEKRNFVGIFCRIRNFDAFFSYFPSSPKTTFF